MREICCLGKRVINYAVKMMTAHNVQGFLLQFFFFIAFFSFVMPLFFSFTFEQSSYRSDCKPNEFEILGKMSLVVGNYYSVAIYIHAIYLFVFHSTKAKFKSMKIILLYPIHPRSSTNDAKFEKSHDTTVFY